MPHLAEVLQGKIELVDLEEPACPMTTYGDDGPVLFRIAHQNIAQDSSYVCVTIGSSLTWGQKRARKQSYAKKSKKCYGGKKKP